jgi:hypothetical protein
MTNPIKGHQIRPGPVGLSFLIIVLAVLFLSLQGTEAMAAGAAPAEKLVNVADTRDLGPGLAKWTGDLYNTSLLNFGLAVVLVMAGMGVVLGLLCDRLVGFLGLDLGKMQHHE